MSDSENNNNALPPKLDLRKKISTPADKPTIKPVVPPNAVPGNGAPANTPDTSRIKLDSKPSTPQPLSSGTKPTPVLTQKPPVSTSPIKLQAKPQPIRPISPVVSTAATPEATPTTSGTKPIALKPKTVKLAPKPPMGIKREGVDTNAPPGSKRSTSKIPLADIVDQPSELTVNTKTIKIKPSLEIKPISGKAPVTATPESDSTAPDPKRQTSRISLESALGSEDSPTGPKTIRLKRPGKTPTVQAQKLETEGKTLNKTSKIETADDDTKVPATQKKTIKIKRQSQKRSAKSISVKRPDSDSAAGTEAEETENPSSSIPIAPLSSLAQAQAPDTAHWTFIVSSIAATIIACVLIYVLSAQVFGPNISLTQLAYKAPDLELPWPGRIPKQQ